ncbi:MAG: Gfo/Idh/MocA family oxidoreductase [Armatimonadetes bacterium]|nr:Gfo/Idh/MocA family oxidoreductase [Armatimonadota bacterium]
MVHGRNLSRLLGVSLVAVVDSVEAVRVRAAQELNAAAEFATLEEALAHSDFDAVCIATPTHTHHPLVLAAARAGKHIFCEKPMAVAEDEALQMMEAIERAGVIFQIGFMRRFDEEFVHAKELISSGALGHLMAVRATTRGPGLPPPWAWDDAKSGGLLAEVNSHDFDAVRWLTGREFARVFTLVATRKAVEVLPQHPTFYDVAVVAFALDDGTPGSIDGAWPVDYGYDARMEVLGADGMLTIGAVGAGSLVHTTRDGRVARRTFGSWRDRHREGYLAEVLHFVECVREGKIPVVTAIDGLRALEVATAAARSARTGQPEPVPRALAPARGS